MNVYDYIWSVTFSSQTAMSCWELRHWSKESPFPLYCLLQKLSTTDISYHQNTLLWNQRKATFPMLALQLFSFFFIFASIVFL